MITKPRSLELFFVNGDPDGMLTATVPFQWSGHVLLTNRTQLKEALQRPEASRPGIYMLVGENDDGALLYIGEGDDISQRIKNHDAKKEWWSQVVFITSNGDQLNKAHARYLESKLIVKAKNVNKIALENGNVTSLPTLSEAAQAHMEDFLENIYLVLPALKFDFFIESTRERKVSHQTNKPSILNQPEYFELVSRKHRIKATAYLENGHFIVEAGSEARKKWGGTPEHNYRKLYNKVLQQGVLSLENEKMVFTEDYSFTSPSAAGAVILGRSVNGPANWKIKGTETTYRQWEEQEIANEADFQATA